MTRLRIWFVLVVLVVALTTAGLWIHQRQGVEWRDVESWHSPLLDDTVSIVLQESGDIEPAATRMVLRSDSGDARVTNWTDLARVATPLDTADEALAYSRLLREFEIPNSIVPGMGAGMPYRSGTPPDFEELLRQRGLWEAVIVEMVGTDFVIDKPVVEIDVLHESARIVVVKETIGRDGSYAFEYTQELMTGSEVSDYVTPSR